MRRAPIVVAALLAGMLIGQLAITDAEVGGAPVTSIPGSGGGRPEVPPALCEQGRRGQPVRCMTFETEWGRPLAIARRDWPEAGRQAEAFHGRAAGG